VRRISLVLFLLVFCSATAMRAQAPAPKPGPEVKKWGIWAGDWTLLGTLKDSPSQQEYEVEWHMHNHWTVGGFALQSDGTLKGNGLELHYLEVLSYDPARKANTYSGFKSDGTTWTGTATFNDRTSVENWTITGPGGEVATCRNDWVVSADGKAISGKSECEHNGVRWTLFTLKGTRTKGGT
jgi:hypothetical protein